MKQPDTLHDTLHGTLPGATTDPQPTIEVYKPDPAAANSRALVIFPGGGYGMLAEHEGKGYAEWYLKYGYTCFVVEYRLGSAGYRHPCMLEDAAAAVHTVRENASAFGICPEKIGVMGSSAGGHLAASLLVHAETFKEQVNCRPDFGILCYPVISFTEACAHIGSRNNLLGENASPELYEELSCEKQVNAQTPAAFSGTPRRTPECRCRTACSLPMPCTATESESSCTSTRKASTGSD